MGVLYDHLSEESKTIIDNTKSTVQALNKANGDLNIIRNNSLKFLSGLKSSNTKETTKQILEYANNGYTIDRDGNVVKGTVLGKRDDNYAKASQMIGVYNALLMRDDIPAAKKAQIKRLISIEAQNIRDEKGNKISVDKARDIVNKLTYTSNVSDSVGGKLLQGVLGGTELGENIGDFLGKVQSVEKFFNSDSESTYGDDFKKYINDIKNDNFNRRGLNSTIRNAVVNKVIPNTDIASLDSRDIDTDKIGFNPTQFVERVKTSLENTSRKLTDYTYNAPKSLNIYLGDDKFKKMIPDIMASLPTGTQLQKDSNLKIVVDKEKGMAKIIASVKEGDEYETQTFDNIKIEDLPPQVINSVSFEDKKSIYSASNPNAVKYNKTVDIVDNKESFLETIDYLPEQKRYEAYKNPPVTQEDIYKNFKAVYGEEIINKYSEEIKNILSTPINISTEPINDKWSIVARQNNQLIYMSEPKDAVYNRNSLDAISEKLATDLIQQRIKAVINGSK